MTVVLVVLVALAGVTPIVLLQHWYPARKPRPERVQLFTRITFCPVCHRIVPKGGCIHGAAETMQVLMQRRST